MLLCCFDPKMHLCLRAYIAVSPQIHCNPSSLTNDVTHFLAVTYHEVRQQKYYMAYLPTTIYCH